MEQKHSLMPWRVVSKTYMVPNTSATETEYEIRDANDMVVTEFLPDPIETEADIRFIVRACNHHDEMREFIEYIKDNTVDDEFGAEELLAKLEAEDE